MDSVLKTSKVEVKSLGRTLAIRELSAKALIEVMDAQNAGNSIRAGAIACKYGVDEWRQEEVDTLLECLNAAVVMEVANLVTNLSEDEEKKTSVIDQSEGLHSDLH